MKKLVLSFIAVLIMFGMVLPISAVEAQSDIKGEKYDVVMNVNEDGRIEVNVVFDVFFSRERQGIYLDIPQRYEMTMNGRTMNYLFPVTDVYSSTHEYDISRSSAGVILRLGSEGVFLTGLQRFEFRYVINTRDLRLDGLQMFYMNMTPPELLFPIERAKYTVNFPKPVTGEVFVHEPSRTLTQKMDGKTFTGYYENRLFQETVTLEIPLPNDFFTFVNIDYSQEMFGLSTIITLLIMVLFFMFGRDPVVIESVQFDAPEGLSSADMGYVYRGMTLQKDVISLIIYWAARGYLTIEELEGSEDIMLHKIKSLPDDTPSEEKRFFKAIFKESDDVNVSTLNTKVGMTITHIMGNLPKRFTRDPELRVFDRNSSFYKGLSIFLSPLIPSLYFAALVYAKAGYFVDGLVSFALSFGIFLVIGIAGSVFLAFDRIHKQSHRSLSLILIPLVTGLLSLLLSAIFLDGFILGFALVVLMFMVAVFASANTGRRTQQGARWLGEILGLKRFIEVAEHDRLVALVEETPEIFYNILPYAYVLDVTDIWSKKFETIAIPQPEWYVSNTPNFTSLILWSHLNRSMNTMSANMISIPASTGSKGGGGSFGGGGGGGFSGGGFGGGGGGGW